MKYFCPVNWREFPMRIKKATDEDENDEEEEFEKRIIDIDKDCKCPFLCCIKPDMKVILYDKNNKELFYIKADCCQCGFFCRNNFMGKTEEAHFFIYNIEIIQLGIFVKKQLSQCLVLKIIILLFFLKKQLLKKKYY